MKSKYLVFAVVILSLMASCTKENDIPENQNEGLSTEELVEMAAADKFAAANSVIRALALITELPDDWESRTFEPEEGIVLNNAYDDIRYIVSTGVDHARSYFNSIVPDLGHEGDNWTHEGVGTLKFREVNDSTCYAIIDVNLIHMPGLKELRFVPENVVGENRYSGQGYYQVGDVVHDTKKNIYWICVRPSGGPGNKSNAYFISFDKSLIKTKGINQKIYAVGADGKLTKNKIDGLSGEWTYATSLTEERIAVAAAHTFAMLNGGATLYDKHGIEEAKGFKEKAKFLKESGILDVKKFLKEPLREDGVDNRANAFGFAYGSYISNSHTKYRQEKYLQPIFFLAEEGITEDGKIIENIARTWYDTDDPLKPTRYYYSMTTDYEPLFYNYFGLWSWCGDNKEGPIGYNEVFDIENYILTYIPKEATGGPYHKYLYGLEYQNVLVTTYTYVKDHGKPYKGFELLTSAYEGTAPDYWGTLEITERRVFDHKNKNKVVENLID